MKVIALSSRKGGAGKSTIAVHLAVAAEAAGLATAIFDLDPQASAALWSDHRGEPTPAVVAAQAPRLRALLKQAVDRGADLVILDTPPHADGVAADAGAVADAILIPCRPSAFDLDAIGASVRLALAAKKPCWVVINAAPIQGSEVSETNAALTAAGVDVSPVVVHQRKAFSARAHEGRTAMEHEPDGKAAHEINALLGWVLQVIGLPGLLISEVTGGGATLVAGDAASAVAHQQASRVAREPARAVADKRSPAVDGNQTRSVTSEPGHAVARNHATLVACKTDSAVAGNGATASVSNLATGVPSYPASGAADTPATKLAGADGSEVAGSLATKAAEPSAAGLLGKIAAKVRKRATSSSRKRGSEVAG